MNDNDKIEAMMVLEYANDQIALEQLFTGIDIGDLVFLAQQILQKGADNLDEAQKTQLAHLNGTLMAN